MRSTIVFFFLSMGLLTLGANLPETFGQEVTGDSTPNFSTDRIPPPPENASPNEMSFLMCQARGFVPEDTFVGWFHSGKAKAASISSSAGNPFQDSPGREERFISSALSIESLYWTESPVSCMVGYKVLPPLAIGKNTGNPLASEISHFRIRSHQDEAKSDASISCAVVGSHPSDLTITWREDALPSTDGVLFREENPPAMTSRITFDDLTQVAGKVFSCTFAGKASTHP